MNDAFPNNDNKNRLKDFSEWQEKAEEDIRSAAKYLKGFLSLHDVNPPKIHQLEELVRRCIEIDPGFKELFDDAAILSTFYVEARYPGDFPEFSMKESEDAYDAATRVKNFVLSKIK